LLSLTETYKGTKKENLEARLLNWVESTPHQHPSLNTTCFGPTAVISALHYRQPALAKLLMRKGVPATGFNDFALVTAVGQDVEFLEMLLQQGLNPNHFGAMSLRRACEEGLIEDVKVLLKYGANPDTAKCRYVAQQNGFTEIVKMMDALDQDN
jgi:ankyrin repeat protein